MAKGLKLSVFDTIVAELNALESEIESADSEEERELRRAEVAELKALVFEVA